MKLLSLVFSIYILGITLIPCMDVFEQDKHDAEIQYSQDEQRPDSSDCELCSPLCSCHCCHVPIVQVMRSAMEFINPQILKSFKVDTSAAAGFTFQHWHPPKA